MDEKKPKGIKLNASQLPLSNKADFVIGGDKRKVLTNKILENLNSSGNHGYFPSSLNREYKAWSVSRELEIPTLPDEAEAQMRMIEGANAEQPLQNEYFAGQSHDLAGHEQAEIGWEQQAESRTGEEPHAQSGWGQQSQPVMGQEQHVEGGWEQQPDFVTAQQQPAQPSQSVWGEPVTGTGREVPEAPLEAQIEPKFGAGSSFAHEFGAAPSSKTEIETAPGDVSDPLPETFSPWSGPVTEAQPSIIVPATQNAVEQNMEAWPESPWAGPVVNEPVNEQSIQISDAQNQVPNQIHDANQSIGRAESRLESGVQPGAADTETERSHSGSDDKASLDGSLLPSWMSEMASDTVDGAATESPQDNAVVAANSMEAEEAKEAEALETFLNSIPDEQFIIDNEVMRHLFASLCEPKITKKVKPAANQASSPGEIVISEAAAEILHSEVPIDAIEMEDVAAADASTLERESSRSSTQGVDFEAIQQAYAMLDLTPLPQIRKTEASFDSVFDMVEKAATELSPDAVSSEGVPQTKKHGKNVQGSSSISRSERGTIEMATHANGRQLIPHYNNCGMLTGVELSQGMRFALSEEKKTWQMIDASGKVMTSGVKSVSFDKQGNLSYVTSGGDTVVMKTDGTVDTIFAKKEKASEDKSAEEARPQKDLELQAEAEKSNLSTRLPKVAAQSENVKAKVENKAKPETVKAKPENIAKPEIAKAKPENIAKPETTKAKPENVTAKPAKSSADKGKPAAKTVAKPEPKPNKSAPKSSTKKPKKTR